MKKYGNYILLFVIIIVVAALSSGRTETRNSQTNADITPLPLERYINSGNYLKNILGGESEGIIDDEDCREKILIEESSYKTYFNRFTCAYQRNSKDTILGGFCTHIDTSWFGGKCNTSYSYEKKSELVLECPENSYADTDLEECFCSKGYDLNKDKRICEKRIVPSSITDLEAEAKSKSVILTWSAAIDKGEIRDYQIVYDSQPITFSGLDWLKKQSQNVTTNTATISDLINDETYYFYVIATNNLGNRSEYWSNVAIATPTATPEEKIAEEKELADLQAKANKACQSKFGVYSYDSSGSCECKVGYEWNDDQTLCAKITFIKVISPNKYSTFGSEPIFAEGETSDNCSKIVVTASNGFNTVNDTYTLEQYSYGDKSFRYRISRDDDNLAFGDNNYMFTAYCDNDQIKQQEIIIKYTQLDPIKRPIFEPYYYKTE